MGVSFIILFTVVVLNYVLCMQVIPERANVGYNNEKYITSVNLYVRRYSRRGNYYINLEGRTKQTWGNNVTVHLIFYEFLHNEYKRSFVELHYKLCDLVNKSIYIGSALRAVGLTCPMPSRSWKLNNITLPTQNYPNVWPFERCRLDIRVETSEKEHIGDLQLYLLFKQGIGN